MSQALRDSKIDDVEFSLILAEENKYEKLKSEIQDKKNDREYHCPMRQKLKYTNKQR